MDGLLMRGHNVEGKVRDLANVGIEVEKVVTTLLHSSLLVFANSEALEIAAVVEQYSDPDPDTTLVRGTTGEFLRALSNPKPHDLTREEARGWRNGYRLCWDQGFLGGLSACAHMAWVTRRYWAALIAAEDFTHKVEVTFTVAGQTTTVVERAVDEAHAKAVASKIRKAQRLRLGKEHVRFARTRIEGIV